MNTTIDPTKLSKLHELDSNIYIPSQFVANKREGALRDKVRPELTPFLRLSGLADKIKTTDGQ